MKKAITTLGLFATLLFASVPVFSAVSCCKDVPGCCKGTTDCCTDGCDCCTK